MGVVYTDAVVKESVGYRRFDFADLNFADDKGVDREYIDDICLIPWTKDVLFGDRKVIIKVICE